MSSIFCRIKRFWPFRVRFSAVELRDLWDTLYIESSEYSNMLLPDISSQHIICSMWPPCRAMHITTQRCILRNTYFSMLGVISQQIVLNGLLLLDHEQIYFYGRISCILNIYITFLLKFSENSLIFLRNALNILFHFLQHFHNYPVFFSKCHKYSLKYIFSKNFSEFLEFFWNASHVLWNSFKIFLKFRETE